MRIQLRRARYVVIRPAPDLPPGFMPDYYNGRWLDKWDIPGAYYGEESSPTPPGTGVAVATGRFERRDDGELAEVYEMQAPSRLPSAT